MAAIQHGASKVLLFARNGANRPVHQDRQILQAGDLTLEQATQDEMLARARRYLHGWGVVAGFIPEILKGDVLRIGAGYGVTPLGDELFLPQTAVLEDVIATILRCCGPGPVGCDVIDTKEIADRDREKAVAIVTAWLIARPASRDASMRAGVPEGCAHPASALQPSRRCGGVEFAIICDLPDSHKPKPRNCEALMPFVCGPGREQPPLPLPWEGGPLLADENFLVIAQLTATGSDLSSDMRQRRTLWPVSLIQDWIASCICPVLDRPSVGPPTKQPDVPTAPSVTTGGGVFTGPPPTLGGGVVIQPAEPPIKTGPTLVATDHVPLTAEEEVASIRDRLTDSVTSISGIGPARAGALADMGVTTEGEFVTAPSDRLATALNLPESKVTEMQQEVSERHNLSRPAG